ncbi:MAG: GerMN domain-containing protein [Tissierellaceae bacterium]|nr:GerMN domain-containing protein [Tissierellaceae bacterium]
MKKPIYILMAIGLMISLLGCKASNPIGEVKSLSSEEMGGGNILYIEDYYPFKENTVMKYKGIGNEYAEQEIYVEFFDDNKAQIKIANPGTIFVKVLENKDGILSEIFAEGEFYHIENVLNANVNANNIILMEPLEIGNKWINEDGSQHEITSLDAQVETPSGDYHALEVTIKYESGAIKKDYYVKDIGLVASIYKDGEFEVSTLLENVENKEQELELTTFYPTRGPISTVSVKQSISFKTNDSVETILEGVMKNPHSDELGPLIGEEVKINSAKVNRNAWVLELDFSDEFQEGMNVGSAMEFEVLRSIVNTLGKFYDVEKVYLTIEGVPYESGHFAIREGEYFVVDVSDIEEKH